MLNDTEKAIETRRSCMVITVIAVIAVITVIAVIAVIAVTTVCCLTSSSRLFHPYRHVIILVKGLL